MQITVSDKLEKQSKSKEEENQIILVVKNFHDLFETVNLVFYWLRPNNFHDLFETVNLVFYWLRPNNFHDPVETVNLAFYWILMLDPTPKDMENWRKQLMR